MKPSRLHAKVPRLQQALKQKPEYYWSRRGRDMALTLFHNMARRVPAYKDILRNHKIDPSTIKSTQDFSRLPLLDKDNYLRKYSREELCWDGKFSEKQWVVSTTSGSTGKPFYFPRTSKQDDYYALSAELYLRENFYIQNRTTLYVDAFAMGAWIGGVFTYEAICRVAEKGYALSIITPGIHKQEVINSIKELGPDFDQVIIGCYPPIMKDIIDLGISEGMNWADYNLGLVFSAEGFGEQFREHVHKAAGIEQPYTGSLNHYGTVDMGTMSHETATSIFIRKETINHKELSQELFGTSHKQPTLTQYMPELFYFETVNESLICTGDSGFPLVRYDLKDNGGVLTNYQVQKAFSKHGLDVKSKLKLHNIADKHWNIPYVYLFERSDFSVKLVGGSIYPEEIRRALLGEDINQKVTGKFTMEVITDSQMNPKLVIHTELKKNELADKKLTNAIQKNIVNTLLSDNSEYVSNYKAYGRKLWPRIVLWANEHEQHFSGRGKQKWVKKQ